MFMAARKTTSATDSRGATSRMALLSAALEEFGLHGPNAASVRDICERAGQNVAAVNYYFGSKEGLYLAVAEHLAASIATGTAQVLEPSQRYLAGTKRSNKQTEEHLGNLLRALVLSIFANVQGSAPALFVIREQANPTAAFAVIFEKLLKPMHETITALVAERIGIAATDIEAIVRAHALISQTLGFRAAKATLRKRTGWKSVDTPGPENVELIARVIVEQSLAAVRAAAKQRGEKT